MLVQIERDLCALELRTEIGLSSVDDNEIRLQREMRSMSGSMRPPTFVRVNASGG